MPPQCPSRAAEISRSEHRTVSPPAALALMLHSSFSTNEGEHDEVALRGGLLYGLRLRLGLSLHVQRAADGRAMHGVGRLERHQGAFGDVPLDGTRFGIYYMFPGAVDQGQGTACAYVDSQATEQQRHALETISTGRAGGGIFELFGADLVTRWLPTQVAPIEFEFHDGAGHVRIEDIAEAASELLTYPDGTIIRPSVDLPHGIEYKRGLMTNAKRWWWRDSELLANYANKYGAVARVTFTEEGCVG